MLPRSWVDALFAKFETMYGQNFIEKWKNTNLENVKQAWSEELGSFDGETLKAALEACKETCKYSPTLPEFYQLCKAMKKAPEHELYLPHHKQYSTEVAEENLKKIKSMLNGAIKKVDNA